MTNKEIVDAYNKLFNLVNDVKSAFPAKVAYYIVHNLRELSGPVSDIEQVRLKILQQYGEPLPLDPGAYKPKEGMEQKLLEELNNLDNTPNQGALTFYNITMQDLNGIDLSLADMDALYFMIDGEV